MRRHLECATPAVLLVAERAVASRDRAVFWNHAMPDRRLRPVLAVCKALGMDVHQLPYSVLLTAGTCDVEGLWRRARPHTRLEAERWHEIVVSTLLFQAREREEIEARRAARRSRAEHAQVTADVGDLVL